MIGNIRWGFSVRSGWRQRTAFLVRVRSPQHAQMKLKSPSLVRYKTHKNTANVVLTLLIRSTWHLLTAVTRPLLTAVTRPLLTAVTQPLLTAITRHLLTAVTRHLLTAVPRHLLTAATRPLLTAVTRPLLTVVTRSLLTAATRPLITAVTRPLLSAVTRPSQGRKCMSAPRVETWYWRLGPRGQFYESAQAKLTYRGYID